MFSLLRWRHAVPRQSCVAIGALPSFASFSSLGHRCSWSSSSLSSPSSSLSLPSSPSQSSSSSSRVLGSRAYASMASTTTLPRLPIFEAIASHDPNSTAVVHSLSGRTFKYGELLGDIRRARDQLHATAGKTDLNGERIAFLVENGYDYVARSIAVPLSPAFPAAELQYILNQSEASLLVNSAKFTAKAGEVLATELDSKPAQWVIEKHRGASPHESITLEGNDPGAAGMMLYTSGTTNRPKGVLLPQSALTAQCLSLKQAWDYSPSDHLLHVLPLHHIHGTVNALLTPLFSGSTIEFLFPFNVDAVWKRLAAPFLPAHDTTHVNGTNGTNGVNGVNGTSHQQKPKITFFTVVPTVYSRLLHAHKNMDPKDPLSEAARTAVSPPHMRLAISGSAALPTPIKEAWRKLSHGSVLLERYGMTEVGMALSCGLDSPADRIDASVGWPLPGVEARLVDVDTGAVIPPGQDVDPATGRERSGEIQLRGPTVFREYWRNPEATGKEFVYDDDDENIDPDSANKGRPWFKTGDVAVRRPVPSAGAGSSGPWAVGDAYFIQGRKSADIIKTGGEKVSALEVERELLALDEISEAAVVAVPSGKWGQKVGAVVILDPAVVPAEEAKTWTPMDMRRALRGRLASYKIPQVLKVVDHIPRNAMGKINKKVLVKDVFADLWSEDEL